MNSRRNVISLNTVTSTNGYAAELIKEGKAYSGLIICAGYQTHGKGQDQRYWESKAGENLLVSFIVKPKNVAPERQFMLNKTASLAVKDFVVKQTDNEEVKIKWPNDIYIGDKKVAGILINNTLQSYKITWSVIGIGVNVNQTVFESDAPNPVSLKMVSQKHYDLDKCLKDLCAAFYRRYDQLVSVDFDRIGREYLSALYRLNQWSEFLYKNEKVRAKITGIGEYGHLILQTTEGNKLQCDLKEVKFL